ncbi:MULTISPECIES: VOC family protein [Bacillus]|uniref:VOC family protein n=1 Tax=Bacillus TaxID=1386 RepID=UPI0006AF2535|nr:MULTISPECIES: VOC family protein [Bacillus]AWD89740.1 glyoxalase [Bacillus velezensis]AWM53654.1 glyoxalase [Bacillus amyloliquefaciens]KAF6696061.1 VOC family protein [Bacillus sp. EKM601B]KOS49991.1 glyoxalase [Bacillus amyloliquefaciens]MBA9147665.1 VOC family protein [Bacillus sp. EKM213B]
MQINNITLYSCALEETKHFYERVLGFPLIDESGDSFTIKAGESELEFRRADSHSHPTYHFAFNIPNNRFDEAKAWIKDKVVFQTEDGEDEVYFSHIQARSFYFKDPSNNLAEFIARETSPPSAEHFSIESVLNIGEVNLTAAEVVSTGRKLQRFGIPVRKHAPLRENGFHFMGDYNDGAFLLLGPSGRRWIFSDQHAEFHPLSVIVNATIRIEADGKGGIDIRRAQPS